MQACRVNVGTSKIAAFRTEHGAIFCEVCGFNFEKNYGALGIGLIEVHHVEAVADYAAERITELSDLVLICSNCRYVVHRDRHYQRNYRQLREVVALRASVRGSRERKKDGA